MTSQRVSKAVEKLIDTLKEIAVYQDDIKTILYGNQCYLMSKDKEKGIIWQEQPKHLAAIELNQRTKLVVLDKDLFKLVSYELFLCQILKI